MSIETEQETSAELTVDALAAEAGMTVRTVRYYAGLGLIPPPVRRGRMAFYSDLHVARLKLVRALQDHGLSLTAIEDYLARIPADSNADELAVQRLALSTWSPQPAERTTRADLDRRAGRPIDEATLGVLVAIGVIEQDGDELELLPGFDAAVKVLALDIRPDGIAAAGAAIKRHTSALAEELTEVFARQVIGPYRSQEHHTAEEAAAFQEAIVQLRELTLEAVVTGFQRAANEVINRSLRG
ncbi:MerR family transcriptional regulator [Nocardioides antri]|uniref:MerR family transcriptional regulator n=1 Tax=Nocardioides antri TaxID=2607659 RepID=A0A5B1M2W0_9ACTN|nr:MerR family transcriptional regulator [Nocardioides antri]KAA1426966.1 MerR family transcriptional regulator [Nocardioides antri]